MLNHTRRAAPPPHLIRLYSPTGLERVAQMDQESRHLPTFTQQSHCSSSSSSSPSSSLLSSSAGHCPTGPNSVASLASSGEDSNCESPTPQHEAPPAYFDLRMKWCKGATFQQRDSLPTSVSMDSILRTPRSAAFSEGGDYNSNYNNSHTVSLDQDDQIKTKAVTQKGTIDWLSKLADSTLRFEGEVLLILQSDQDPRRRKTEAKMAEN